MPSACSRSRGKSRYDTICSDFLHNLHPGTSREPPVAICKFIQANGPDLTGSIIKGQNAVAWLPPFMTSTCTYGAVRTFKPLRVRRSVRPANRHVTIELQNNDGGEIESRTKSNGHCCRRLGVFVHCFWRCIYSSGTCTRVWWAAARIWHKRFPCDALRLSVQLSSCSAGSL